MKIIGYIDEAKEDSTFDDQDLDGLVIGMDMKGVKKIAHKTKDKGKLFGVTISNADQLEKAGELQPDLVRIPANKAVDLVLHKAIRDRFRGIILHVDTTNVGARDRNRFMAASASTVEYSASTTDDVFIYPRAKGLQLSRSKNALFYAQAAAMNGVKYLALDLAKISDAVIAEIADWLKASEKDLALIKTERP